MKSNIPYGRQNITDEDIEAVVKTLQGDYLTQGPAIAKFETEFSEYIGCKYAVAVANGTAALHLSALALNVSSGDQVITSPISFSATANCIKYCGAEVVFADIDPETLLLDINNVRKLLMSSPRGTYKGVIPVDFGGLPVNMELYRELAVEFGIWIIEDSCHAPGAYFIDSHGTKQNSGNGNFADLAIFSFHPVKHIACGEGGMITTNNEDLYNRLLTLRTHGIVKNEALFSNSVEQAGGDVAQSKYPGWYMEMQELGYNYRITDFQAALGSSQLKRADKGLKQRIEIAKRYDLAFAEVKQLKLQPQSVTSRHCQHAYHLYVVQAENRLGLYNYLKENLIFAQIHYYPIHLMPYYRQQGWKEGDLPFSEDYYKYCISLPMFPTLTEEEQQYVIGKVKSFYN